MAECGASLFLVPLSLKEANGWVAEFHRHNKPVTGHKFPFGVSDGMELHGVLIAGRPVARALDDGWTSEVYRVCVTDRAPKGSCSMLYAAAWRCWKAQGGTSIITYTLQTESGESLRGAGWRRVKEIAARIGEQNWNSRPDRTTQIVTEAAKWRWCCP